jgi:hypothetical protein
MSDANGALAGLSTDELRAAVRAVLREVLPAGIAADAAGPPPPGQGDVRITSDVDLTAFVRRIATLCEDPAQRAALQGGRHAFRLVPDGFEASSGPRQPPPPPPNVTRIERGAVTERAVLRAANEGARLLLGRGAVLTPLARDKARTLGVEIEKER